MSALAFLGGTAVKNPPANVGDTRQGFDPWVRKSPWRRKWHTLQDCCLGVPMDRGSWQIQLKDSQIVGHN